MGLVARVFLYLLWEAISVHSLKLPASRSATFLHHLHLGSTASIDTSIVSLGRLKPPPELPRLALSSAICFKSPRSRDSALFQPYVGYYQ